MPGSVIWTDRITLSASVKLLHNCGSIWRLLISVSSSLASWNRSVSHLSLSFSLPCFSLSSSVYLPDRVKVSSLRGWVYPAQSKYKNISSCVVVHVFQMCRSAPKHCSVFFLCVFFWARQKCNFASTNDMSLGWKYLFVRIMKNERSHWEIMAQKLHTFL